MINIAKAKQLPSGSWRVQVFDGTDERGKRKYISFTADTSKEAELLALEYQLKKKRSDKPKNITVGEVIDRYIESKDAVLSPSTIREYNRMRNNYIQNLINVKLDKVTPELIQRELNKEAKTHSPKTLKNINNLLMPSLKEYFPNTVFKTTLPQRQKKDIYIPTHEDIKILMKAAKETKLYIPILLAVYLGLRRSEISALRWQDINFKNMTVTIRQARVLNDENEKVIKSPKTYTSNRVIKVSKALCNELAKYKNDNRSDGTDEFVTDVNLDYMTHGCAKLIKAIGVPHFRFHDLRHFNASVMLMLRIPDKYAMERGGWATEYTMKNVYQHTFESETNEYENQVNNYMDNLLMENND